MGSRRKMQRTWMSFVAFVMLVYTMLGPIATVSAAETSEDNLVELTVLHTNDLHAKINDFGKIAAYIKAEREAAENSLYLDAGDIFSGNPVVDLQYGVPIVDLLNDMGVQAMAIGNHDFDYGQEETVKRINESNFPWLSANTVVGDNTDVDFPQPEPSKIFDVNGLKVGVVSVTETPPSTAPANVVGISFEDPIETMKQFAHLKDETDILIALTHMGYDMDQKLAREVDFFDVIIGGHSHTTLSQPRVVNGTPIVQTGANGENVGNLTITFNQATKEVESVTGELQKVSSLTEVDSEIQAKVDYYNAEMGELLSEEIGYTETGLTRSGNRDSSLGNFWTDAMRHHTNSDVALTNNGGIRANIAPGSITVNDIYTIEPFANEIMKYEMTGAALKEVIKYSYERRSSIDLQTSGLHYKIITNNTGKYIDSELVVDGEPVEDNKTYIVAVGDYIGTGGSGYNFEGEVLEALSGTMTDAMITYAKHLTENGEKINYQNNQRISIEVSNDAPIVGNEIGSTKNGLSSDNKALGDAGLGNLYTDSVRAITDADFAFLNGSSVSGNIPAGVITDGQIEFLDSYGNKIVVVKTNLNKIKDVILTQSNYHNSVDLQVSGLHYELIKENNVFTDVVFSTPEGNPLDEEKEYVVAYNDYMHGSSFYNLGDETVGEYEEVWKAVVDYVSNHDGPIDYEEGSRITIQDNTEIVAPEERDYITVAEAIANNTGTKTVQGYIVGTMTEKFDGDFAKTNLMLADSPNERDMDRIIPVQLPNNSIRTDLNLVDNPDNLGKLIQITGSLEAYFSKPGLKSPSAYEFVEEVEVPEEPTPEEPSEPIDIADARLVGNGEEVTIEGTVTTKTGNWGSKGFYVQDETAGIYVFQGNVDLEAGDVVRLTGEKGVYSGEMQISAVSSIEKVGNSAVPAAKKVTPSEISKENEAQLVQVEGAVISELEKVNDYGTFEFIATVGGESVLVRVDNRTGLVFDDFAFANGDQVNVTGISSQFNGTIQLKPRGVNDIVVFEEEPVEEPPSEEIPGEETPNEEQPGEETPGEETPNEEQPGEETPNEEQPGEETPGEETPNEEQPGEETPGEETPNEEQPGEETPGEETPNEEQPGDETPGEETPNEEQPGEETPGEETPNEEQPGEETPGEETPKHERVDAEVIISDEAVAIADESIASLEEKGTISVDLSKVQGNNVQLDLTSEQLASLLEKDATIEVVRGKEVSLQIPTSLFADRHELSIVLEQLSIENPISPVYDFTILDGESIISKFTGEGITLQFAVNVDAVTDTNALGVYFLNDQGEWELIGGEYRDGYVIATTNHFSTFTVLEAEDNSKEDPQTPGDQNGNNDSDKDKDKEKDKDKDKDKDSDQTPGPGNNKDNKKEEDGNKTGNTKDGNSNKSEEGKKLPKTASSMYNWLMAGILFILLGGAVWYMQRKRIVE
ncbi:5'-nucleotidase C-terminal domain-containing protein [Ornithinibacillus sp. FSL M8-0202]|uniref:5'-nucleotidase C-terminal domain-containing protein n=1 Tax=Ornithinibacillus sp. FSL M8-0202 TaxID=2921616 RepID=UPI0030CBDE7D